MSRRRARTVEPVAEETADPQYTSEAEQPEEEELELEEHDELEGEEDEQEEEEEDDEDEDEEGEGEGEGEGEEELEEEGADRDTVNQQRSAKRRRTDRNARGKRGRKPLPVLPSIISEEGKSYEVVNDEYNLTEDEEGETKIDKDGHLKGDRHFKVRTFTVKGKGNKLFMLSTEPARCVGFRDSYLLFQKHKLLHKYVLNQDEKYDLIDRDIIPHSYKGRVIGLVTARSIFREFGAKVVVGGKYVIDDYYPERIRKFGLVKEGELAQPDDLSLGNKSYNQNQYVAWHGASNVYHQSGSNAPVYHQPQFESLELKSMKALRSTNYINEENWMHKHAEASSSFNQGLNLKRQDNLQRGFKDVYTGLTFIPNLTQPQHVKFTKVVDSNATDNGKRHRLIYETNISSNNLVKRTGLSSVPLKIFEDCVDEQTLKAILEQQRLEQTQF